MTASALTFAHSGALSGESSTPHTPRIATHSHHSVLRRRVKSSPSSNKIAWIALNW